MIITLDSVCGAGNDTRGLGENTAYVRIGEIVGSFGNRWRAISNDGLVHRSSRRRSGSAGCASALAELCSVYWRPIYAYLRGRVAHRTTRQDITQDFFLRLMRREAFARLAPNLGRFRSFLADLAEELRFSDFDRRRARKKRGGGLQFIYTTR